MLMNKFFTEPEYFTGPINHKKVMKNENGQSFYVRPLINEIINELISCAIGETQDSHLNSGFSNDKFDEKLFKIPDLNAYGFSAKKQSDIRVFYSNIRGFSSKKEVLDKIIYHIDSDVIILNETHLSLESKPYLNCFRTFHRNRQSREKGGIAILVNNKIARNCTVIYEGEQENESLAILLNDCSPPLVIATMYGVQNNTFGVFTPQTNFKEFFGQIHLWRKNGYDVLVAADMNQALGRTNIPGNDELETSTGRLVNQRIIDYGLYVCNNMVANPCTHVDLKSKLERCLDVVLTSNKERVSHFYIDHNMDITPFNIRYKGGKMTKIPSDHRSILLDYNVGVNLDQLKPVIKQVKWQYNKIDDYKYEINTDLGFEHIIALAEHAPTVDIMVHRVEKFIRKSKYISYKKRRYSREHLEEFNCEDTWRLRIDELIKIEEEMEEEKETNKVFKTKILLENRNKSDAVSSVKNEETGEILEDIDEIFDYILLFNEENMKKNEVSDEIKYIQDLKKKFVDSVLSEKDNFPQKIPWDIYVKAVKRVMKQRKGVFRDFIKSGSRFKVAVYFILNRVYEEELIPSGFYEATLTKIFKKRGSKSNLKDHRFIHNRSWASKLIEKCLVLMIQEDLDRSTPPSQIGGIRDHSTCEHILTLTSLMRVNEFLKKPTLLTLIDVQKCFDACRSSDIFYDIAKSGADPKTLSVLMKLNEKIIIRLNDDPKEDRTAVIDETLGQGQGLACKGIGLTMGLSVDEAIPDDNNDKVGDTVVPPQTFMDDAALANKDAEAARDNGIRITNALELISLRANSKKSVIVVSGTNKDQVKSIKCDLNDNPVKIHNAPINCVEVSDYLGFAIHEDGLKCSVNKAVKDRVKRGWGRVASIQNIMKSPAILQFGWLRCGVTLTQAVIPAVLTYGAEAWLCVPKYVINNLELAYKQMIYSIFGFGEKTKFSAVLLELGLMRIKHIVARMQISYMSSVVWERVGSTVHNVVMEEFNLLGEKSALAEVDKLAISYGFQKVSECHIDKKVLKKAVKSVSDNENWYDCFISPIITTRPHLRVKDKSHFRWSKLKAKALLAFRVGALKFKYNWRIYNVKRGIGINCLHPLCNENDTLFHVQRCKFYRTIWKDKYNDSEESLAEYLLKLNTERINTYRMPII